MISCLQARERRGSSLTWATARAASGSATPCPAFRGGFPPDTISTDLHMGNINGPVVSMLNTMSKFLSMGMPLQEVIWRSTSRAGAGDRPARVGHAEPGAEADVAVFQRAGRDLRLRRLRQGPHDRHAEAGMRADPARRADRLRPDRAEHAGLGERPRSLIGYCPVQPVAPKLILEKFKHVLAEASPSN